MNLQGERLATRRDSSSRRPPQAPKNVYPPLGSAGGDVVFAGTAAGGEGMSSVWRC